MLDVDFKVKQLRLSHVHKIFNGTCPSYLSEHFIKASDVHHHFTRGSTENFTVSSVSDVAATTFYYSGIKIGFLYPWMSNKCALSMVSNLLQDNILDLKGNLWNQIPMFIINMHLVVPFAP